MHICEFSSPCLNHGTCLKVITNSAENLDDKQNENQQREYKCSCLSPFAGENCELGINYL
jgi:hypothetical protein